MGATCIRARGTTWVLAAAWSLQCLNWWSPSIQAVSRASVRSSTSIFSFVYAFAAPERQIQSLPTPTLRRLIWILTRCLLAPVMPVPSVLLLGSTRPHFLIRIPIKCLKVWRVLEQCQQNQKYRVSKKREILLQRVDLGSHTEKVCSEENMDSHKQDEQTCPICTDAIADHCTLSHCEHAFCYSCIRHWCKLNTSCPCCRAIICWIVDSRGVQHIIGAPKEQASPAAESEAWIPVGFDEPSLSSFDYYEIDSPANDPEFVLEESEPSSEDSPLSSVVPSPSSSSSLSSSSSVQSASSSVEMIDQPYVPAPTNRRQASHQLHEQAIQLQTRLSHYRTEWVRSVRLAAPPPPSISRPSRAHSARPTPYSAKSPPSTDLINARINRLPQQNRRNSKH